MTPMNTIVTNNTNEVPNDQLVCSAPDLTELIVCVGISGPSGGTLAGVAIEEDETVNDMRVVLPLL
jgi:hypothetical protein